MTDQISEALEHRVTQIETIADEYRQDMEASKLTSGILALTCVVLSTNPFFALGAAGAGLLYGWSLFEDYKQTKKFALLPCVRKNPVELAVRAGSRDEEVDDPLADVLGYVSPQVAHEFELIMVAGADLERFLTQQKPESRLKAYKYVVRQTLLRGSLKLPQGKELAQLRPADESSTHTQSEAIEVTARPVSKYHQKKSSIDVNTSDVEPLLKTDSLPEFPVEKIVNESKGIMIAGDMGSAKTSVAIYLANHFPNHRIIVLDPHDDDEKNWGNIERYTSLDDIFAVMSTLITLLDQKDKSPVFILCDEWLEIRTDRRNKKGEYEGIADDFIRLFSTKSRKFNKVALFILHSHNCEAAGVDGNLRENYQIIYLGNIARRFHQNLKECAYPCVLGGVQYEHPTHGHHSTFRPKGNIPRGLRPLGNSSSISSASNENLSDQERYEQWVNGATSEDVNELIDRMRGDRNDSEMKPETISEEPETEETISDTRNKPKQRENNSPGDFGMVSRNHFTLAKLTREQTSSLIETLKRKGLSQTEIIKDLWGVKPGDNSPYKQAREEYRQVTGE
ncbi:MAG: hypothetical protein F6K58_19885 [Symploca sp. SIO2E9]|nr:hypothetical protein [Symploca sp. SIO2E9]